MRTYSASHLSRPEIRQSLIEKVGVSNAAETDVLVLLAEADLRRMYLDEGYPSMHDWCIDFFHFSKDAAARRIHAARTAREFPLLFAAVEDGRLHLTAIRLIAPHLTPENVEEIVAAVTHRTCEEVEEFLARRFVRLKTFLDGKDGPSPQALDPPLIPEGSDPTPAGTTLPIAGATLPTGEEVTLMIPSHALRRTMTAPTPRPTSPHAPEPRVNVALEKRVHEALQYARALLSHSLPLASESQVIERALHDLIAKVERAKFGAAKRPRPPRPNELRARGIPAHVRRVVWLRDGGQCTFVSESGRRCEARRLIEFDHIEPVAHGGKATTDNLRLRCRGHNQLEAERTFGAAFMQRRRVERQNAWRSSISVPGRRPSG